MAPLTATESAPERERWFGAAKAKQTAGALAGSQSAKQKDWPTLDLLVVASGDAKVMASR